MTTTARAQQLPSVPQTLSLQDAVDVALRYSPAHRQQVNDQRSAGWAVRNSYASFLPSMNVTGSLGYAGPGESRFANTAFTQPAVKSSRYSINLNWSLNRSTLVQPALNSAQLDAAQAQARQSEINIYNQIVQQYLNTVQAREEVILARAQLESDQQTVRLTQARRDVGQASILDVRQAEVARGQSEVTLLQEEQDVKIEKLRLFQLMGIPSPEDPSMVELTDTFEVVEPEWDLEELVAIAREQNPDLNTLRAREAAADWQVEAARSSYFPTISASASWSGFTQVVTTDSDVLVEQQRASTLNNLAACQDQNAIIEAANQLGAGVGLNDCSRFTFTPDDAQAIREQNSSWPFSFTRSPFSAGLFISFPIFNNFNRPLQVSQAAVAREDASEAARARELQVVTDVSQTYYAMLTAYQTIEIQERNRSAARDALRVVRERYRLGQDTFVNVLATQLQARQAEFNYLQALFNYHRQVANMEAAVGRQLR